MSERVLYYQNNAFQTGFQAAESENDQPGALQDVAHLQELTPYGPLLASLASCTAIVLNSFANNHESPLESVTIDCQFSRVFADGCENCDKNTKYEEIIQESLAFEGDLAEKQRQVLH